jgi:dihydrolipoamide dehydrogenase
VTVYVGSATLASTSAPFQVTVADNDESVKSLEAQHVLLAAGSVPARLPVPGCDNPAVWTSDDLLGERGTEPFQSLLMIGGGVIGVEMASIYAGLGVSVTILEAEARCLPMMDTELGRSAEMLLKSRGVTVLTGARLQKITPTDTGFTAAYEKNGITDEVTAERVLLATGRVPATSGLLADGVSLAMNRRFIAVNTQYETSVPGIYAIGDVNGQNQLAHAAHAQGVAAVSAMLGIASPIDPTLVPSCVYTAPEIASVGLTQDEAKAQNRDVAIGKALTTQNARTLIEGLGRGFIKLLFDRQTHVLLGAQLFCGRATDIAGELALALQNGLTAEAMMRTLRAHPTFEEAVTDAISAVKF